MSLTQNTFTGTLEGHEITVEARTGPIAGRFLLKVDGEVQDTAKAVNGEHWLEGRLPAREGRPAKSFRIRFVLRLFGVLGEQYWLQVDGEEREFGQGWIF